MVTELILSPTHKRFVYVCSLPILATKCMLGGWWLKERQLGISMYMLPSP
jgi:hypothetical protein